MQLFPCPFCGLRGEAEFHFGGEYANARPEGESVGDDAWSSYLYLRGNPKGASAEVWIHLTCGEVFRMDRNTVDHTVAGSTALV
jgi:sarcosine oxidase subunit delta